MKTTLHNSPFLPALAILLATMFSGCGYNTMVQEREAIDAAWAQVENQLQRRNDLIPNLVETTKGFAAQEKDIFTAVAEARSKLIGAGSRAQQIDASNQLTGALSRLLAISEAYPQLKSDAQFIRLSDELAGTENRISTERRRYNEAVRTYNVTIKSFPTNFFAGCFGFEKQTYFEVPKAAQAVPEVKF